MRFQLFAVVALLVSLLHTASAQEVELRNDAFESGDTAAAQGGFVVGEMGAVCLVPATSGAFTVTKVRLLYGGDGGGTNRTITLRIYDNPGCTLLPGTQLFTADYELTSSDSAFQEIDLTLDNVQVPGAFRVAIEFQTGGAPSIMRDTDELLSPTQPTRNYIYDSSPAWVQSSTYFVTGDWIIRAFVIASAATPDAGPTPDAAPIVFTDAGPADPDAGSAGPDAGSGQTCVVHSECPTGQYCDDSNHCTYDCRIANDCPTTGMECTSLGQCVEGDGDGGGCGCQTPTRPAAPLGTLLLAFVGLLWWRRRR